MTKTHMSTRGMATQRLMCAANTGKAIVFTALFMQLAGCLSVTPVIGESGRNLLMVTCNSASINACRSEAARACPEGYRTVAVDDSARSDEMLETRSRRSLTFECFGQVIAGKQQVDHDDLVKAGVFSR